MKIYVRAANVADIQAKIAKKQAEIDKKTAWIQKKEDAITKKLNLLKGKISDEDYTNLVDYLELLRNNSRFRLPDGPRVNTWEMVKRYGFSYDDKLGKALYSITDDAESIHNSKVAISEAQPILDKYNNQLATIKKKDKQIDEIPEVLKDFMTQLIDEWDRFDKNIRDKSQPFYKELKNKMNELIPDIYSNAGTEKLLELYPSYKKWYEKSDTRLSIKFRMRDDFKDDYLEKPFKKKFGVSTAYAISLWHMTDAQIHEDNVKEGKKVILDLVNRVTKVTGPITDWAGLYARPGNGGWTVLNGTVEGEDGKAEVNTILAGGYNIQRLHCRTLVKEIR